MVKKIAIIISVFITIILLPVFVLADNSLPYKIENVSVKYDGRNTIVSGKISASISLSDYVIVVKFYEKGKPTNNLIINTKKQAILGAFSVTIANFKVPNNYLAEVSLLKNEKPTITSVRFANLPRTAAEGVYAGEKIAIVWNTRAISSDATMTIMMYPINEGGSKGTPTILATNEENDGIYEFIVPTGLLRTTEPDYKPYMASVKYQNVSKDAEGFIYIKHLGCPIFVFAPESYENESLIQKVSVIDPGDAVKGDVGIKLFRSVNKIPERDPIEFEDGNRADIDFSKSEFSIKTKSELDANSQYYGYMHGNFWNTDGDLLRCIARRYYFTTPKDFYAGQVKRIEVDPVPTPKTPYKVGDKIEIKWKTFGINPKEKVYVSIASAKGLVYLRGYSTPSGVAVPNTGKYTLAIPSALKDMTANVQVAYKDAKAQEIIRGISKSFNVVASKSPLVSISNFDVRYYGLVLSANLENASAYKNPKIWINSKRLRNDNSTFPGENEQNMFDDGKFYKDIGFDSDKKSIDAKTGNVSIYFPSKDNIKTYPGKILFRPGVHYLAIVYFVSDDTPITQIASFDYWSKDTKKIESVKVSDLGYVVFDKSTFEVSGQIMAQGYSSEGVSPYLEVASSEQDYNDGTEGKNFTFFAKGSNPLSPKKVKAGNRFSIRAYASEIDLSKSPWIYHLCAQDAGDSFSGIKKFCLPFVNLPATKYDSTKSAP